VLFGQSRSCLRFHSNRNFPSEEIATVPECFFSERISSAIGNSGFVVETGAEPWRTGQHSSTGNRLRVIGASESQQFRTGDQNP
jgi:hypothetical protein